MKNNIKKLWNKIPKEDRAKVILELSELTKVKPNTIQRHWLCDSGFWSVPDRHLKEVTSYFQIRIYNQTFK